MTGLLWIVAAASLLGVWINIHRHVACFWTVTNATWAAVDLVHGLAAQAALQFVYFGLSVYGLVRWRRDEHEAAN